MNRSVRILWLCCLFGLMSCVMAAPMKPVVVKGTASFAKGGELRLYTYNDLLSKNLVLLTQTEVGADGSFSFTLPNIREVTMLTLNYNATYGSLYVEPGRTYEVDLYTDSLLIQRIDAEMLGNYIQITCLNSDSNELNWRINYFDQYYTYFMYYNGAAILRHAPKEVYDSLLNIIQTRFPVSDAATDFYQVYVRYKIAAIESMYYDKAKEKVYKKYLETPYVFYENPAYMDFLNLFFENYLYSGTKKVTKGMLFQDINELNNYSKLLDDMGKDPLLQNEIIRELVLIKGLSELRAYPDEFKIANVDAMLISLAKSTKFREHKILANNQLASIKNLNKGNNMPTFDLLDVNGNHVTQDRFSGKYLYIQFFTTYCQDCMREMLILKYYRSIYGDNVEFLSVMLDFEPVKLYHFVQTYKEFDWQFVQFNNQFDFIDRFKPYALPLGMLVDPKGKVVAYPTPPATDGLGELFMMLFSDKK